MMTVRQKRGVILFCLLVGCFCLYVVAANINSKNMTGRQKFLKAVYPVFMGMNKLLGRRIKIKKNPNGLLPPVSFYSLNTIANDGRVIHFEEFRGKKVLLVNTASDCGYTSQYAELEKLYKQYRDKLVVIGFPANDFNEQEKGSDSGIAKFCRENYGVSFPLASKSRVIPGAGQNSVFEWLATKNQNGWNDQQPVWNFSKYLVNEEGTLIDYFDPSVSPLDTVITAVIGN
jgi:glutathione peroxidase